MVHLVFRFEDVIGVDDANEPSPGGTPPNGWQMHLEAG